MACLIALVPTDKDHFLLGPGNGGLCARRSQNAPVFEVLFNRLKRLFDLRVLTKHGLRKAAPPRDFRGVELSVAQVAEPVIGAIALRNPRIEPGVGFRDVPAISHGWFR